MKKILLFVGCMVATMQLQAQESVVLQLDVKANTNYKITFEDKDSTITNLLGDKDMVELLKKEGAEFPTYETTENNTTYNLQWTKAKKNKLDFVLDLDNIVTREFKANSLVSTDVEKDIKGFTSGTLDVKKGLKLTKELNGKYASLEEDLTTLLDDLFNSSGFPETPIKVNDTFDSEAQKKVKLSAENEVLLTVKESVKLTKIENNKAYLLIESLITSESTSEKFAEMKGKESKVVVYDMKDKYFESINGEVSMTVNIATDGDLTINMTNNKTQNVKISKI